MLKNEVQRRESKGIKISLRVTKKVSKFLREENLSPTAIFDKSVEELMKEK